MYRLMTNHDLPPQSNSRPETDEITGAELVVAGLVRALQSSTEVLVEKTDTGFELTLPGTTGPAAA